MTHVQAARTTRTAWAPLPVHHKLRRQHVCAAGKEPPRKALWRVLRRAVGMDVDEHQHGTRPHTPAQARRSVKQKEKRERREEFITTIIKDTCYVLAFLVAASFLQLDLTKGAHISQAQMWQIGLGASALNVVATLLYLPDWGPAPATATQIVLPFWVHEKRDRVLSPDADLTAKCGSSPLYWCEVSHDRSPRLSGGVAWQALCILAVVFCAEAPSRPGKAAEFVSIVDRSAVCDEVKKRSRLPTETGPGSLQQQRDDYEAWLQRVRTSSLPAALKRKGYEEYAEVQVGVLKAFLESACTGSPALLRWWLRGSVVIVPHALTTAAVLCNRERQGWRQVSSDAPTAEEADASASAAVPAPADVDDANVGGARGAAIAALTALGVVENKMQPVQQGADTAKRRKRDTVPGRLRMQAQSVADKYVRAAVLRNQGHMERAFMPALRSLSYDEEDEGFARDLLLEALKDVQQQSYNDLWWRVQPVPLSLAKDASLYSAVRRKSSTRETLAVAQAVAHSRLQAKSTADSVAQVRRIHTAADEVCLCASLWPCNTC